MGIDEDTGTYFWRGGKKINVSKQNQSFTAYISDEKKLKRLESLSGVLRIKPITRGIFKVDVPSEERDKAMDLLRKNEGIVTHHTYMPTASPLTHYYLTDSIIVKFHSNTPRKTIESVFSETKVMILKEYLESPKTFLVKVTDESQKNPIKVANLIAKQNEVEFAEPNLVVPRESSYLPRDTYFGHQWHLNSVEGPELDANADVSAIEAWDITKGKRSVVVAVIDDGFDLLHPDFTGRGKVVHPKDYVDGDASPFPCGDNYHGTPCAGIAIAEENGQGVVGIAPGCSFMPIRFPFDASDDLVATIFSYVGRHADVISCSWSYRPGYYPLSSILSMKFHQLAIEGGPRKKGCIIVFSAGNYDCPINSPDEHKIYKWGSNGKIIEGKGPILFGEGADPNVITVSASTSLNKKALYSNWGMEIFLCAPSDNHHPINSTT